MYGKKLSKFMFWVVFKKRMLLVDCLTNRSSIC